MFDLGGKQDEGKILHHFCTTLGGNTLICDLSGGITLTRQGVAAEPRILKHSLAKMVKPQGDLGFL